MSASFSRLRILRYCYLQLQWGSCVLVVGGCFACSTWAKSGSLCLQDPGGLLQAVIKSNPMLSKILSMLCHRV